MSDISNDDKQSSDSTGRRNLIKTMAAGGAFVVATPGKWTTPVVDSVVLPAHATTTQPNNCGTPGSGSSNTAGLNANITAAVLGGGGELIVVGEADVPDDCFDPNGDGEFNRGLTCIVRDCNRTTLFSEDTDTFGDIGSGGCSEAGEVCMVSCSVEVAPGDHSVEVGDAVTLRFRFLGGCVVSAVGTVT